MTPRADFACLSRKCRSETEGAAPIYELPVGATRCPVCGSKRLQRLWNRAPAVLRGAQPEPVNLRSSGRVGEGFAVPLSQIPATLAKFGGRAQAVQIPGGAANVTPGQFHPVQGQMTGPKPAPGSLHDTKWAIRGGKAVKR